MDLTESDSAVALLWFWDETGEKQEASAREIADLMHELSLRGQVNVSRLAGKLAAHRDLVKGKSKGSFKIKLARKEELAEVYEPLLTRKKAKVGAHIIDPEDFAGTRRYLQSLVTQINGSYQYSFYDGCAVLLRRLMETLLIEAFEQNGVGAAIKQDKNYIQLSDIIGVAASGQYLKLSRGVGKDLEAIKSVGDAAAHSRTYITKKADIDDVKHVFRKVISELAHLAKIEPSSER